MKLDRLAKAGNTATTMATNIAIATAMAVAMDMAEAILFPCDRVFLHPTKAPRSHTLPWPAMAGQGSVCDLGALVGCRNTLSQGNKIASAISIATAIAVAMAMFVAMVVAVLPALASLSSFTVR